MQNTRESFLVLRLPPVTEEIPGQMLSSIPRVKDNDHFLALHVNHAQVSGVFNQRALPDSGGSGGKGG
jgi:hypothetical protein